MKKSMNYEICDISKLLKKDYRIGKILLNF